MSQPCSLANCHLEAQSEASIFYIDGYATSTYLCQKHYEKCLNQTYKVTLNEFKAEFHDYITGELDDGKTDGEFQPFPDDIDRDEDEDDSADEESADEDSDAGEDDNPEQDYAFINAETKKTLDEWKINRKRKADDCRDDIQRLNEKVVLEWYGDDSYKEKLSLFQEAKIKVDDLKKRALTPEEIPEDILNRFERRRTVIEREGKQLLKRLKVEIAKKENDLAAREKEYELCL